MPRPIALPEEKVNWLRQNHDSLPYPEQAKVIGCCVDTLKRILVRLNLQTFEGAKYHPSRNFGEKVWTRPCMNCKDDTPRPKNWYFCTSCRREMGYDDQQS